MDVAKELDKRFSGLASEVFLIDAIQGGSYTYAEWGSLVADRARAFASAGLVPGDRVLLLLNNSAEYAAQYFACLASGVTAVPVNLALHENEIRYIIRHARAKSAVAAEAVTVFDDEIRHLPVRRIGAAGGRLSVSSAGGAEPPLPLSPGGRRQVLSVNFTSGTTGMPKGVVHHADALLRNASEFNAYMGFDGRSRFYHVMPMAYMAGFLNTLLCPFMAGGSVVIAQPFGPQSAMDFWGPVTAHGANTFWFSPTMLAALVRLDRSSAARAYCATSVRMVCVGTAPLPLRVRRDFESKYGTDPHESYGLSELLFITTNRTGRTAPDGSVGEVLPGIELRTADEAGRPLPSGETGEIQVRTPYAMAGYLSPETGKPEPPAGDWFSTGDIGHTDAQGHTFVTGRKKDLIIRGGINVSPRAVEEALLGHDAVQHAAVVGVPHDFLGEEIVGVLVLKPGRTLDAEKASLDGWCREHLNAASRPTRFVQTSEFPVSVTGKVQKAKLVEMLSAEQQSRR